MAFELVPMLIGLGSGAIGGNVAGALMKSAMGPLGRSITGILGGAGLSTIGQMSGMFGAADPTAGGSLTPASVLKNGGSGLVGGGILTAILGMFNKA